MGRELPGPTPRFMLTVASIEARLGHTAEALQWLKKYAATGLTYDVAKDDDLKGLLAEAAGQKIAAQMKERSSPVTNTEFVCTLPQTDIMPEDIAYLRSGDAKTAGNFFVTRFSATRSIEYRCLSPAVRNVPCKSCHCLRKPNAGPRWRFLLIPRESPLGHCFRHAWIQRLFQRR